MKVAFCFRQLHGNKQHIRALLIDRVLLQHEVSVATRTFPLQESQLVPVITMQNEIMYFYCELTCFCVITDEEAGGGGQ